MRNRSYSWSLRDEVLRHGDHVVRLDRAGDLHAHHAGQVGVLAEVLEVASGGHRAVQAQPRPLQHVLAQVHALAADEVAVVPGELRVEGRRHPDGHRERGGRGRRRPVPHPDADRAVGDPHPGDAEFVVGDDVALDPDLGRQLFQLLGVELLARQGVDVDRLHVAVQLPDLLVQIHRGH